MIIAEPNIIEFHSIESGKLYVMTFSLRNTSKISQRIRIQAPKTDIFALNYIPSGVVAPGLDIRAEIECHIPKSSKDVYFMDRIVASLGDFILEIPLKASKPHPIISHDKVINLGNIGKDQTITRKIVFKNIGTSTGYVSLEFIENSVIKVDKNNFEILSNNECIINISFAIKEVGSFREVITVKCNDTLLDSLIDLSAIVVERDLLLLTYKEDSNLESINTGYVYYNDKHITKATLVNTSHHTLSYSFGLSEENDNNNNEITNEMEELLYYYKRIVIYPSQGIIKPFSKISIDITFDPIKHVPNQGFTHSYQNQQNIPLVINKDIILDILETNKRKTINFNSQLIFPIIKLNYTTLYFGERNVNDYCNVLLEMTNESLSNITYKFTKHAYYKFKPHHGSLLPNERCSVIVTFMPKTLGVHNITAQLIIGNDLQIYSILLEGESNTINKTKLLKTNALDNKFINQNEIIEQKRLGIYNQKKKVFIDSDNILDIKDDITSSQEQSNSIIAFDEEAKRSIEMKRERQLKKFNDKTYNDFLTKSYKKRVDSTKQISKSIDPYGVDMGMTFNLPEPKLKIPEPTEGLWLNNSNSKSDHNRIPIDENRLIIKKYPSIITTQAESRDCRLELTTDELSLVSASHKTIDFGRIFVGSTISKNFVITNDLKKYICVKLYDFDMELKQSKPDCQIIPKECVAGFDIYFTSKTLGKYRSFFTWSINNIHIYKVVILAEIIPIELNINFNEIVFEFPNDSIESFMTKEIILTNPGNVTAEYIFTQTNSFQCKPEKGNIDANQSIIITIIWKPTSLKRNVDEIGLIVTGGINKSIKVKGILNEVKGEFEDKKLNLGLLVVGITKKYAIKLKNLSNNISVFYMHPVNDTYGIKYVPEKGFIEPNSFILIDVYITSKDATSYENVNINASFRGGDTVAIKLLGESIIPKYDINNNISNQSNNLLLNFYQTPCSTEQYLPLYLTNITKVLGILILDLSKYLDFRPILLLDDSTIYTYHKLHKQIDEYGNRLELSHEATIYPSVYQSVNEMVLLENVWIISVNPLSTIHLNLLFTPNHVYNYKFKLPLYKYGIPNDISLQYDVEAEAVQPIIQISNKFIDFNERVISKDNSMKLSYFIEFTIGNIDNRNHHSYEIKSYPTTLSIKGKTKEEVVENEGSPIYFISPIKNDLSINSQTTVRITFTPRICGEYEKKLELYIDNTIDSDKPYLTILCKGIGIYPKLTFDQELLKLPIVPLDIISSNVFTINNQGYIYFDCSNYYVSPTIPVPIHISFPDGYELDMNRKSIRVVVSFISNIPMSFTGKIEFRNSENEKFSIKICGCSDNCLFTNYSFVSSNKDKYSYIYIDNQPVKYLTISDVIELRNQDGKRKELLKLQKQIEKLGSKTESKLDINTEASQADSKIDSKSINKFKKTKPETVINNTNIMNSFNDINVNQIIASNTVSIYHDIEIKALLKWLNKFICKETFDLNRYPDCLLDRDGDLMIETVEIIIGHKVVTKHSNNTNLINNLISNLSTNTTMYISNQLNKITSSISKYQTLFNYLISSGCLLSHVQFEFLISKDDYFIYKQNELSNLLDVTISSSKIETYKEVWGINWSKYHLTSWIDCIYQCIKVFVLQRITYTDYCVIPGMLHINTLEHKKNDKKNDKSDKIDKNTIKKNKIPNQFVGSNIYTTSELLLLSWISYHIQHSFHLKDDGYNVTNVSNIADTFSNNSMNSPTNNTSSKPTNNLYGVYKHIIDLDIEFNDYNNFNRLCHSHIPDLATIDNPLYGYTNISRLNDKFNDKYIDKEQIIMDTYNYLRNTLNYLNMNYINDATDLFNGRVYLLLLIQLYNNLPNFIPKTKIEFKGLLGISIDKIIILSNPSKKKLSYHVTIRGSNEYSIDYEDIELLPETSVEYIVKLNARFTNMPVSYIIFWGKKENGYYSKTMVFQLHANIIGRKPINVIYKNIELFNYDIVSIDVNNPFEQQGSYNIQLDTNYNPTSIEESISNLLNNNINNNKSIKKRNNIATNQANLSVITSNNEADNSDSEFDYLFKQPVWLDDKSIDFSINQLVTIKLNVLSFQLGIYVCYIIFTNPIIGEFCIELHVTISLPKICDTLEFDSLIYYNANNKPQITNKVIRLSNRNIIFDKALSTSIDMRVSNISKKVKARLALQSLLASYINNTIYCIELVSNNVNNSLIIYNNQINLLSDYNYDITDNKRTYLTNNRNKKVIKTIIETPNNLEISNIQNINSFTNNMYIAFQPSRPGTYIFKCAIYSKDNPNDIRVIDIVAKANLPDIKTTIEMKGSCRQVIYQDIPISNQSSKDWQLNVNIIGKCFYGNKSIHIPKGETINYQLIFLPNLIEIYEGTLVFKNVESNDVYKYTLIGTGEEPLVEDHLYFKCKARSSKTFTIRLNQINIDKILGDNKIDIKAESKVDNRLVRLDSNIDNKLVRLDSKIDSKLVRLDSKIDNNLLKTDSKMDKDKMVDKTTINLTQNMRVETDIPYLSSGSSISIPKNGVDYEFTISCPISGLLSGSITFIDIQTGAMVWYLIDIEVSPPEAEIAISIESIVRKVVSAQIKLDNPYSEYIDLSVVIEGEGLIGDNKFTLSPNGANDNNKVYELIYSPLVDGKFIGKIIFSNSKIGEFWYSLYLTAIKPDPIIIPQVECMVGSTTDVTIDIENPLYETITLSISFNNTMHYMTKSKELTLNPYEQASFLVTFIPSSFTIIENCNLSIYHPKFGTIEYILSGQGLLPGIMNKLSVYSPLNEVILSTLLFHNPFTFPLPVDISIDDNNSNDDIFVLLLRQGNNYVIQGKGSLLISYSFHPKRLIQYEASLQIRSTVQGRSLMWCYPIQGMADAGAPIDIGKITTKCKSSTTKDITVDLIGLYKQDLVDQVDPTINDFVVEVNTNETYKPLVSRSFRIQPIDILLKENEYSIDYRLLFEPLKTFTIPIELIIVYKNIGRWKINLILVSTDPDPDDKIILSASVGTSDSAIFKLNNRFLGYSPFQAYFTMKSSNSFTIQPSSGVLTPFDQEGTSFTITFTPKEYGMTEKGTLIVVTEDAQWTYSVFGQFPNRHVDLSRVKSKVDSGLKK